ncbi:ATP-binding protein [Granulicella cerasi]|uniref:histidine kinase n=1 Tax=Granulicella cerasi TaxID=741063 RepID=A0ABW1Z5J0_9BACT
MSESFQSHSSTFRPRARLLQLLGDQLIGSARLAVFELVKNAYDADASKVSVEIGGLGTDEPTISVTDDGEGMSLSTLTDIWLVPGHENREVQRQRLIRSPKFHRLPLGEKGVGRFAVHKLGNSIELVTRHAGCRECVVRIDWNQIISKPFLSEAPVQIEERSPQVFTGQRTGTQITISDLRQKHWSRGDIRRLQRQITTIVSPFDEPGSFSAVLEVPGRELWIAGIPDVGTILSRATWKFSFELIDGEYNWFYQFLRIPLLRLEGRELVGTGEKLLLPPSTKRDKVTATADFQEGIGPVSGDFYVYDRDRDYLRLLTESKLVTDYLDENGGVRVYRDGIRVYNYGEPTDDWLGLDMRRVNTPTRSISRNIIIGAINLQLDSSQALVEKTNREGFVEDQALLHLKDIVLGALMTLEVERQKDKEAIRSLTGKASDIETEKIRQPLNELRRAIRREGLEGKLFKYVDKIELDYEDMQRTLLHAGMAGINLGVVFHEVERGVKTLHRAIQMGENRQTVQEQSEGLMGLLDGFATILRRDDGAVQSAKKVIDRARRNNSLRFNHHRVRFEAPILEGGLGDFDAQMSFGLVVGAVGNLIDNALYWVRVRWPDVPAKSQMTPRKIYAGITNELEEGPAIIIADNGPGLKDAPDRVVSPFYTRRPGGMGLGLYYVNMVMQLSGGSLRFLEPGKSTCLKDMTELSLH